MVLQVVTTSQKMSTTITDIDNECFFSKGVNEKAFMAVDSHSTSI